MLISSKGAWIGVESYKTLGLHAYSAEAVGDTRVVVVSLDLYERELVNEKRVGHVESDQTNLFDIRFDSLRPKKENSYEGNSISHV
jgi:hypothetical protein